MKDTSRPATVERNDIGWPRRKLPMVVALVGTYLVAAVLNSLFFGG